MGVAEDHDVGRDIAPAPAPAVGRPELVAVADVNRDAAEGHDALARQRRIVRIVDVAVDRFDRRDSGQGVEHLSSRRRRRRAGST